MVTISKALNEAVEKLKGKVFTPILDSEVLLSKILNKDRLYLIVNKEEQLTEEEYRKYKEIIDKRFQGMPVQYLTNNQEFMGLDFYVEEGVLIPRPDTEILVEKVINHIDNTKEYNILDIGTGSGAITVSLAKYFVNSTVYSIDVSKKAISIGRKNADRHGVLSRIKFLKGSLFEPLEEIDIKGKIDILVSNPPYIPSEEIEKLQIEVSKYEPRLALDGGKDGLYFYRKIIDKAPKYLRYNGFIALEVGHNQAGKVVEFMRKNGCYKDIEITEDLAGIERVVSAHIQL
ncbi:release factor glutamine methyltransferase [Caminicella sporogenes DSM 14501]|uniref:Release factor glutamine methyltransferase n=1 Tax=Caminicella sporogenes DSM 14501 TaxID=1121266 RepID=A0A1M6PSP7_9FIRM|nr:peptide chain release factor N(5)-glutamine methyltransferase [Caminicella sporogenes]RKD21993.1 protein-(glutamine-N5) methyltransferase, release factor-specific [Caminicella sporogenes]SHK10912.1 release factor glutamine methyltransferase [Caminicella sporogenes DSM 14501]